MKSRPAMRMQAGVGSQIPPGSEIAASCANASAMLGATLLVDLEDMNAVLRTALLLGKGLGSSVSVDVLGKKAFQVGAGEEMSRASLAGLLESIQGTLRRSAPAEPPVFVLEASITGASFLSAGVIAVRIRAADSTPQRPVLAR